MSKDNFNKYITQRTNRDCCLYSIVETIQSTSQLISAEYFSCYQKKNSAGGGMTAPAVLCDREDRLTPDKKIPEPLPHPYTAAP